MTCSYLYVFFFLSKRQLAGAIKIILSNKMYKVQAGSKVKGRQKYMLQRNN